MVLTWSQWKKYSEKSYPETKIKLRHLDWVSHGMRDVLLDRSFDTESSSEKRLSPYYLQLALCDL